MDRLKRSAAPTVTRSIRGVAPITAAPDRVAGSIIARLNRRAALVAAAMLVLASGACSRDRGDEGPYAEHVRTAIPIIERSTGLSFREPPRLEARSRDQIRGYLETQMRERTTDAEWESEQTLYRMFGMIPDTFDLRAFTLEVLAEQVVGYYDPQTKVLYVREDAPREQTAMIIGHELVHALQDQHMNLDSAFSIKGDQDRVMAGRAVVEGQATLVGYRVMLGGADLAMQFPGGWDRVRQMIREGSTGMPVFAAAPMPIQEILLFPYLSGAEFVRRFESQHPGRSPLGDALPVSTTQVMHSDRYFPEPTVPVRVGLGRLRGGTPLYDNNLGEFQIRLMLFQHLRNQSLAVRAAAGWSGDRYGLVRTPAGDALVWVSVWQNSSEAAEFAQAMRDWIMRRHGAAAPQRTADGIERFTGRERTLTLWGGEAGGRSVVIYHDVPAGFQGSLIEVGELVIEPAP